MVHSPVQIESFYQMMNFENNGNENDELYGNYKERKESLNGTSRPGREGEGGEGSSVGVMDCEVRSTYILMCISVCIFIYYLDIYIRYLYILIHMYICMYGITNLRG